MILLLTMILRHFFALPVFPFSCVFLDLILRFYALARFSLLCYGAFAFSACQCCQIWGKFPIWGENDISVEKKFRSLYSKWGIFGRVSIKYLGNLKIPFVVNGEFIENFLGISKK
jgi:hypothetical protein